MIQHPEKFINITAHGQGLDRRAARREAPDYEGDNLPAHQQAEGHGPPRRGQREREGDDAQGVPDPVREPLEGMELRRVERRDRDGKLPEDRRPPREARGAEAVSPWTPKGSSR